MSLQIYRDQIDDIDNSIIKLLKKRVLISGVIGRVKRKNGDKSEDLDRQDEIIKRLRKQNNKLKGDDIESVFLNIFELSKKYQNRKIKRKSISQIPKLF